MRSRRERQPGGWLQFTVSGVPSGQAAGLVAWLQIATAPKHAIATPDELRDRHPAVGPTDPLFAGPAPPSTTRGYNPRDERRL